jgi:hypothetical protein
MAHAQISRLVFEFPKSRGTNKEKSQAVTDSIKQQV